MANSTVQSPNRRHSTILAIVIPLLISLLWAKHFWPHLSDDGAIFFRYAENLAAGHGPVWNLGEPVEGFSSPLWLLLLSAAVILGAPVIAVAKWMGISFALLSLICLGLSLKDNVEAPYLSASMVGASLTAGLFYWAPSGMETPLVVFLWSVTWYLWGTHRGLIPLSLLGVARPEGALLVLSALLLWKDSPKALKGIHLLSFLPVGLWFCFRLWYYGDFFPNTYYAKMGGALTERLLSGWNYSAPILLVWGCAFFSAEKSVRRQWLWILIGLLSVVWGGGDWMWWGRLLVPFSMLLWLAFPVILNGRWWLIVPFLWGLSHVLLPYKGVLACLQLKTLPEIGWQEGTLMPSSQAQADVIRTILPSGSLIAVNHAGFLPYFLPEYQFIDMTGLNDHHIAHSARGALHQKYDPEYVLSRAPNAILFHRRTPPPDESMLSELDYWAGETALAAHPDFKANYSVLGDYWVRKASGGSTVYAILGIRL